MNPIDSLSENQFTLVYKIWTLRRMHHVGLNFIKTGSWVLLVILGGWSAIIG